MTLLGWLLALYLAGAVIVLAVDAGLGKKDALALLAYPVLMPAAGLAQEWRMWACTCADCGKYYGTRERMHAHYDYRVGCVIPPPEPAATKDASTETGEGSSGAGEPDPSITP